MLAIVGPPVLALICILGTSGAARHQTPHRLADVGACALAAAGALALLAVRRSPVWTLWLVIAVTMAYLFRGYPYGPFIFAPAIALFCAVLLGHRAAAWFGFGLLYAAHLVASHWVLREQLTWGEALGVAAWGSVILAVAEVARVRRERRAAAALAQRETARRQADEERLRIARELHDVVAHHLSLINVQSGVALHLVDRRPEQVETALAVIKDASKEALGELRVLVGVLRDEAERAPRSPANTLASIDALVERSAVAGLTIERRITGVVRPLPAAVELAAYRIVQEAITNVVRHAGARRAVLFLGYGPDVLEVQVDDDGSGGPDGPPEAWDLLGNGLRGMSERATALGGTLSVGRSPLGGVRVSATLPCEVES